MSQDEKDYFRLLINIQIWSQIPLSNPSVSIFFMPNKIAARNALQSLGGLASAW